MKRLRYIARQAVSFRSVFALFLLAIIIGMAGISGTSAVLPDSFEAKPEGQAILQINVEVASVLLSLAIGALIFRFEQRRKEREAAEAVTAEQARIHAITQRRMHRIVHEVARLAERHAELSAGIYEPVRYIWKRSAWYSAEEHLREHLTKPGLFYALENFYMSADALRDADHDRALHI